MNILRDRDKGAGSTCFIICLNSLNSARVMTVIKTAFFRDYRFLLHRGSWLLRGAIFYGFSQLPSLDDWSQSWPASVLLGKDCICYTARDKDGNHRVEGVFPTKGQTCYQHDGPIYQERNTTNILTRFLANGQTDNIRPTTGDIVAKSKANPQAHDNTPKRALIMGSSVKVATGTNWIKKELMDTVIKVKTVNLCQFDTKPRPSKEINGVEGH